MTEDVQPQRHQVAERMRRSRQRRREGSRCIPIEIRNSDIEALIAGSLLDPVARNDPVAIGAALSKLLDRLSPKHQDVQTEYVRICLRLSAGFIDLVVTLGWLSEDGRHNPAAITAALARFTGRAVALSQKTPVLYRA